MNKRAYYSEDLNSFLIESKDSILGKLANNNQYELTLEQKNAWTAQIDCLKENLEVLDSGYLFFEYTIPRMGKRCDVVLIYKDTVFIIEFKVGSDSYGSMDVRQTIDYALDLKNFHQESHDKKIVPVLVSTNSKDVTNKLNFSDDLISNCQFSNGKHLASIIFSATEDLRIINPLKWVNSSYQPTPTIIEAAKSLYKDHNVEAISRSDASHTNLSLTCDTIKEIIDYSKEHKQKSICFVTGVPGAGKTLAGLNVATSLMDADEKEYSTFLSGNGPLVAVLQRALAVDKSERGMKIGV